MGRWTADQHDVVLRAKMKCLVAGAIERHNIAASSAASRAQISPYGANADDVEPQISYNHFVEELDTGDSFTSTLIDILVKELADRKQRVVEDRRSIARHTSASLRNLALHTRVPWEPSHRRLHRRPSSANLASTYSEYMTEPADVVLFTEDEEDLDTIDPNTTTTANNISTNTNSNSNNENSNSTSYNSYGHSSTEGLSNASTELYNAYLNDAPHWPVLPRPPRGYGPSHSRLIDDLPPPLSLPSSPPSMARSGSWSLTHHGPGASLSRQSSIRRPVIPRPTSGSGRRLPPVPHAQRFPMNEFMEFTSGRRASLRQQHDTDPREPSSYREREREDLERLFPTSFRSRRFANPPSRTTSNPMSLRERALYSSGDAAFSAGTPGFSVPPDSNIHTNPWASTVHLPLPTPSATSSSQDDEDYTTTTAGSGSGSASASAASGTGAGPTIRAYRRLRRGGVRPPESILPSTWELEFINATTTPPSPPTSIARASEVLGGVGEHGAAGVPNMPPSPVSAPVSPPQHEEAQGGEVAAAGGVEGSNGEMDAPPPPVAPTE